MEHVTEPYLNSECRGVCHFRIDHARLFWPCEGFVLVVDICIMESLSHQRGCTSLIHAKNLSFYVGHSSASRVDVGERPVLGLPIDTNWKWFSLYLSFPVRVPEKLEQCTTKMTNRWCSSSFALQVLPVMTWKMYVANFYSLCTYVTTSHLLWRFLRFSSAFRVQMDI